MIATFTFNDGRGWTRRVRDGLYEQVTQHQAVHVARLRREHRHLPVTVTWCTRQRASTTHFSGSLGQFLDHMPARRHLTLQLVVSSIGAVLSWTPSREGKFNSSEAPTTGCVPKDNEDVHSGDNLSEPESSPVRDSHPDGDEQRGASSCQSSKGFGDNAMNDPDKGPEHSYGADSKAPSGLRQDMNDEVPKEDQLGDFAAAGVVQTEVPPATRDKGTVDKSYGKKKFVDLQEGHEGKILQTPEGDGGGSDGNSNDEPKMEDGAFFSCMGTHQLSRQGTEAATTAAAFPSMSSPGETPPPKTDTQRLRESGLQQNSQTAHQLLRSSGQSVVDAQPYYRSALRLPSSRALDFLRSPDSPQSRAYALLKCRVSPNESPTCTTRHWQHGCRDGNLFIFMKTLGKALVTFSLLVLVLWLLVMWLLTVWLLLLWLMLHEKEPST